MGRKYQCEQCLGDFETEDEWTQADAAIEAKALFGIENIYDKTAVAEVCDDCFIELTGQKPLKIAKG